MCKWKAFATKKNLNVTAVINELKNHKDTQWLMPSVRFKLRAEIDQFFEDNQIKGRVILESDMIASLARSVIDGIGLSFLPLLYVAREIREKSVKVIRLKKGFWKYRVWLACHTQNKNDPLIKALAQSFKDICNQALG